MRDHRGWHSRGYLPHFDSPQVTQHIVFRLADSLPVGAIDGAFDDLEDRLDQGAGACVLREASAARQVCDTLRHFDGHRYALLAWCVMPNHVHGVLRLVEGYRLGDVVKSWKTFSARAINLQLGASGAVWARDYFDRYARDANHAAQMIAYVEDNPVKAGLVSVAEDWPWSSAGMPDREPPVRT